MKLLRRERSARPQSGRVTPRVEALLVAARSEAILLRHGSIGTEHVLLALLADPGEAGRVLRRLADPGAVRADVVQIVGIGPEPGAWLDADALGSIGVDVDAVRARVDAAFGEGALDRAHGARGRCGGAGFGIAPHLKRVFEAARASADRRGDADIAWADVMLALPQVGETPAARILHDRGITLDRLATALERERGG